MDVVFESGEVRKIARCEDERSRLGGEAVLLAWAAHPGVVRLVSCSGGDPPSELRLDEVRGQSLAQLAKPMEWSEIAGLGAAAATTLADLHDIGVVHRGISEEHILLDEEGRPVLCGFSSGLRCDDPSQLRVHAAADAASLATLLLRLGDGSPSRCVARALRSCRNRRHVARGESCRRLARALVEAVPDARLPGSPSVEPSPVRKNARRINHRALATLAIGLGAVGFMIPALFGERTMRLDADGHANGIHCPTVDDGCSGRAVGAGSVITSPAGSFMLVGIEGVAAVGRWRCGGVGFPAVLDVANGHVWMFDGWPNSPSGEGARLVATIPAGSGLRVIPRSRHGSGCDTLLVERQGLPPAVLDISRA